MITSQTSRDKKPKKFNDPSFRNIKTDFSPDHTEIDIHNKTDLKQSRISSDYDFNNDFESFAKKYNCGNETNQYNKNMELMKEMYSEEEEIKIVKLKKFLNHTKNLAAENSREIDQIMDDISEISKRPAFSDIPLNDFVPRIRDKKYLEKNHNENQYSLELNNLSKEENIEIEHEYEDVHINIQKSNRLIRKNELVNFNNNVTENAVINSQLTIVSNKNSKKSGHSTYKNGKFSFKIKENNSSSVIVDDEEIRIQLESNSHRESMRTGDYV